METSATSPSRQLAASPFRCGHPGCSSAYTRKANLEAHVLSYHSLPNENVLPFTCGIGDCKKVFRRADLRSRHRRTEHGTTQRRYVCGLALEHRGNGCGREFKRKDAMEQHRRTKKASLVCSRRRYRAALAPASLLSSANQTPRAQSPTSDTSELNSGTDSDVGSVSRLTLEPTNRSSGSGPRPTPRSQSPALFPIPQEMPLQLDVIHHKLWTIYKRSLHPTRLGISAISDDVAHPLEQCLPSDHDESWTGAVMHHELGRGLRTISTELKSAQAAYDDYFNALARCSQIVARLRDMAAQAVAEQRGDGKGQVATEPEKGADLVSDLAEAAPAEDEHSATRSTAIWDSLVALAASGFPG